MEQRSKAVVINRAGGCKPVSAPLFHGWIVLQAKLYLFKGGPKMVLDGTMLTVNDYLETDKFFAYYY